MIRKSEFDHIFQTKLDSWTMMRSRFHDLFSQREIDALQRSERAFQPGARTAVFVSFENRFAALGGLAAVTRYLPQAIHEAGERVVFVTPYHSRLQSIQRAEKAGLFKCLFTGVVFHLCDYEGVLACYQDTSADLPSYYIDLKDRFTAAQNPYAYDNPEDLLIDSLAFAAAIPFVLNRLGHTGNLIFHAHDWEAAPIAITSKLAVVSNLLQQARTVLTLHNSFDTGLPDRLKKQFFGKVIAGDTLLQCTIPFLNGPLTTVSTPFAHELRHDPLQRGVFTNHLQGVFSINPPIGIENGMFGEPTSPFTSATLTRASGGNLDKLLAQKHALRKRFLAKLLETDDPNIIGRLAMDSDDTETPVFFMSGRLDYMQKGFDSIFRAFAELPRGKAKLFFCPSSYIDDGSNSLGFFEDIAASCKGDITIWPFRIPLSDYELFLKGATFLLMPSFYEPFGAATEGLIHGTPVVARGAGGLWIQVNPYDGIYSPAFYGNILRFEERKLLPTGVLYREECPDDLAEAQWRDLLKLPPAKRIETSLFKAIVESATHALRMALDIFSNQQLYGTMILNATNTVHEFSWKNAARKYRRVYDAASYRGQ